MKNSVYFTCLKLTGHGHLKCKAFNDGCKRAYLGVYLFNIFAAESEVLIMN